MKFSLCSDRSGVKPLLTLALALCAMTLTACSRSDNSGGRRIDFELNSRQFFVDEPLATVNFANGAQRSFTMNYGSGAFRSTLEDNNIFYTVTDRGPSFPCSDSQAVIGMANFCAGGNSGRVFPVETYAPRITTWKLDGIGIDLTLEQLDAIELRDSFGNTLTGLPNQQNQSASETGYSSTGIVLLPDANGVDPGALVKLSNGRFWVAEEYGPSLLLVESDGEVAERQLPAGSAGDYASSTVPISDVYLPAALARRKLNQGIEALALSPNEDFLYYVVQSPLSNANSDSRVVRIGKLALDVNGGISSFVGEYLYRLDTPQQFADRLAGTGDIGLAQSEITINEAVALNEDFLVLVEQGREVSKYYKVNLADAVSISGSQFDFATGSGAAENQYLIESVPFVPKQLGFDTLSQLLPNTIDPLSDPVDGFALLNSNFAAVANDSSWGVYGARSRIAIVPIGAFVVAGSGPVRPTFSYGNSVTAAVNRPQSIAADTLNNRLFVADGQNTAVSIFDIEAPLSPSLSAQSLDSAAVASDSGISLGAAQAVAVGVEYVAAAYSNSNPQQPGVVGLFKRDTLELLGSYIAGAMPRSMAFSLFNNALYVTNSGEPNDSYTVDPEGSVTVINFADGIDSIVVTTVDFRDFNVGGSRAAELPQGVRITGPGATVAQDLEPESVSLSLDASLAFVSLQENNAVALINLSDNSIARILALGEKDFGAAGNELDVNNDGAVNLDLWPGVSGLYQPGGLATYQFQGTNLFVTANTGLARDYAGFSELSQASDLIVDSGNPSAAAAADDGQLGRLQVSNASGDVDGDGDFDALSAFGARSFSIWDADGNRLFDSASDMARSTLAILGSNAFNDRDALSEMRGIAPKGVSLIASGGRVYAYISFEDLGGIAVYDITSPYGVQFVQYINNRNFAGGGDLSPQSVVGFFKDGVGYLAVANAGSNSVRIFEVDAGL